MHRGSQRVGVCATRGSVDGWFLILFRDHDREKKR